MSDHLRKIIIGLIAVAVVAGAFVIYTHFVDTQPIRVSQSDQQGQTLEEPVFSSTQQIAGNQIGGIDDAEFITLDEVTKQPKRIFGFEELLNPEENSEKWRLKKPYMRFFGESFQCEIVSKEGNVQVETVLGNPSPRNAKLYNDVRINITFENNGVPVSGVIYLEDLDYDSERSELATENSVEAVFDDVIMEGTGMVLIYNTAKGRIEYFEMVDLDIIRIKDLAMLSDKKDSDESTGTLEIPEDKQAAKTVAAESSVSAKRTVAVGSEDKAATEVKDAQIKKADDEKCFYNCKFRKEVRIEYGDEVVVVGRDELNINNILFMSSSSASKTQSQADASQGETSLAVKPEPKDTAAAFKEKPVAVSGGDQKQGGEELPVKDQSPEVSSDKATEVIVTCKGGFVIKPMANVKAAAKIQERSFAGDSLETLLAKIENAEVPESSAPAADKTETTNVIAAKVMPETFLEPKEIRYANLAAAAGEGNTKPTRFHAAKIDYDLITKNAYATGPVKLLIYMQDEEKSVAEEKQIPITITAKDNAEYFSDMDRMVFNGNVIGSRKTVSEEYVTDNTFYGDQLVADLASGAGGDGSIRHVAVLGEEVMMDSVKKAGEVTVSYVRLKCDRIDYDADKEVITASGPGRIEINNENAPESEDQADGSPNLQGPCYAWIEDFDVLKWSTITNKIVVDAMTDSMKITHVPINDGEYGLPVYAAARHVEANFMITLEGRTELATLTAKESVSYNEKGKNGNNFIGEKLSYNVNDSMLVITGTPENPCSVNGIKTKRIKYDLRTRELVTGFSRPGAFSLPRSQRK